MLLLSLFDRSSLNAISDSNHTCHVKLREGGTFENDDLADMIESVNNHRVPDYNGRTAKLQAMVFGELGAPFGTESSRCLLHDIPVEVVPDLLGLIQCRPSELPQAHSWMYDFLKAMPCIFVPRPRYDIVVTRKRKWDFTD